MTDRTYHVIGPPGTGKTRYLSRQAENAVHASGSKSVVICSLTKAASREIAGRNNLVAEENIGTLHAHCFRALGQPSIAEAHIKEWNEEAGEALQLTSNTNNMEMAGKPTDADRLLSAMNINRSNMLPVEDWPYLAGLTNFHEKWSEWKEGNELMDFTDMVEACMNDVDEHPAKPSVMLGDEAQDWSKMEAVLFREKWGQHASTVVMAGDEDQSLYVWRGSDPHIFSGHPIPKENTKILEQSYRVPRSVHKEAQRWIRQITDRTDVVYKPKETDGRVILNHGIRYKYPEEMCRQLEENEGTSMILASCGYMVNNICTFLRTAGIPFHNPYRTSNGAWNPLVSRRGVVTSSDRLYAFLFPDNDNSGATNMDRWSKEAMARWVPLLGGVFKSGVKKMVEAGDFKLPKNTTEWGYFFKNDEDLLKCLQLNLDWFNENVIKSKSSVMQFPVQIAKKRGKSALGKKPQIIVGTIHSVKGGEADHVYLFPDISLQSARDVTATDSITRMMYVGMTRAKESLTLCGPSTKFAVRW